MSLIAFTSIQSCPHTLSIKDWYLRMFEFADADITITSILPTTTRMVLSIPPGGVSCAPACRTCRSATLGLCTTDGAYAVVHNPRVADLHVLPEDEGRGAADPPGRYGQDHPGGGGEDGGNCYVSICELKHA